MRDREGGATSVEYALMLGGIFVVIVASVQALGLGLVALFAAPLAGF